MIWHVYSRYDIRDWSTIIIRDSNYPAFGRINLGAPLNVAFEIPYLISARRMPSLDIYIQRSYHSVQGADRLARR